jgi:signal transduction histidine kinase
VDCLLPKDGVSHGIHYLRVSVLDMWLLVALSAWLFQSVLNLPLQARFTLGWYCLFGMMLISDLIVMLALIAESNRLYARLALSTAARKRERDARLMSLDAVTAAIAHEVGQPLTAVGLNTSAAVNWLSGARPDVKKALAALQAVSEGGQRTFAIIRSIRATFAKEPGRMSELSLNDVVLDTASLLDRELAAINVSVDLSLDEALPPIRADRVQMQRVLVNIFTNAIESLRAISDRPRRIAVRSTLVAGQDVLLQVSDTGAGIASEDMEHIFDVFFTTKATGTGLGLALCRTIVEEHGGRLWASQGEPHGATFNLQLPRSGAAAIAGEATHALLANLETSLSSLREAGSEGLTDAIAELQHVIEQVRVSLPPPTS